jgi:hypothetical protein
LLILYTLSISTSIPRLFLIHFSSFFSGVSFFLSLIPFHKLLCCSFSAVFPCALVYLPCIAFCSSFHCFLSSSLFPPASLSRISVYLWFCFRISFTSSLSFWIMFFRSSISVSLLFSFGGGLAVFLLFFFMSLFSSSSLCLFRLSFVEYPSTSLFSCFLIFYFSLFMQNLLPLLALCVAYFRAPRGFLPISFFVREKLISFFCFLPITLRCGSATPILTVYFTPTRLVLCPFFCFFFFHLHNRPLLFSLSPLTLDFLSARNGQNSGLIAKRRITVFTQLNSIQKPSSSNNLYHKYHYHHL